MFFGLLGEDRMHGFPIWFAWSWLLEKDMDYHVSRRMGWDEQNTCILKIWLQNLLLIYSGHLSTVADLRSRSHLRSPSPSRWQRVYRGGCSQKTDWGDEKSHLFASDTCILHKRWGFRGLRYLHSMSLRTMNGWIVEQNAITIRRLHYYIYASSLSLSVSLGTSRERKISQEIFTNSRLLKEKGFLSSRLFACVTME